LQALPIKQWATFEIAPKHSVCWCSKSLAYVSACDPKAVGKSVVRYWLFNEMVAYGGFWSIHFYKLWDAALPLGVLDSSELLVERFGLAPAANLYTTSKRGGDPLTGDPAEGDLDELPMNEDDEMEHEPGEGGADVDGDDVTVCGGGAAAMLLLAAELDLAVAIAYGDDEDDAAVPPPPAVHVGGSSSSSGPAAPSAPIERNRSEVSVKFAGGTITWYKSSNTLVAYCGPHGQRCRLTRTANSSPKKLPQGRPIGLLAAWLKMGCGISSGDHNLMRFLTFSHADRICARNELVTSTQADLELLLSKERKPRDGEGDEPEGDP
jgi:hypothetical protein